MVQIIDAFNDFAGRFQDNLDLPLEEKIDLWEEIHAAKFPELCKKCKEEYERAGYSWREIAAGQVFVRTKEDFSKMLEAYTGLLEIIPEICKKAQQDFSVNLDVFILLYAGLGNSAGWVTEYAGKRAVLFGIDKIAELRWHTREKLLPLIAHEFCHVINFQIRGKSGLRDDREDTNYTRGIWRLYEEGFAQFFQYKLLGNNRDSRPETWMLECKRNRNQLKKLYLEALFDEDKGTRDFYGDWYKVLGISTQDIIWELSLSGS